MPRNKNKKLVAKEREIKIKKRTVKQCVKGVLVG